MFLRRSVAKALPNPCVLVFFFFLILPSNCLPNLDDAACVQKFLGLSAGNICVRICVRVCIACRISLDGFFSFHSSVIDYYTADISFEPNRQGRRATAIVIRDPGAR